MRRADAMTAYDSTPRAHARPDALRNFGRGNVRFGSDSVLWAMSAQCPVCPKADKAGRFTDDRAMPRATLPGAVTYYITKSDSSGTTHSGGSPRATRCTLS